MLRSKDAGLAFGAVMFGLMGLLQLLRLALQWELVLNGFAVPFWVSGIAFAICWLLAGWFICLRLPGKGAQVR